MPTFRSHHHLERAESAGPKDRHAGSLSSADRMPFPVSADHCAARGTAITLAVGDLPEQAEPWGIVAIAPTVDDGVKAARPAAGAVVLSTPAYCSPAVRGIPRAGRRTGKQRPSAAA